MVKAVLIIGGSGLIGTQLALRLREGYKVFATYHRHPMTMPGVTYLPFAVDNRNWVKRVVYTARPDVIVYAAGKNDLAWAEEYPRETEAIHTSGPATVSNVSGIFQTRFIYLSNCFIFDGSKGNYHETDTPIPASVLGKAKAGGENFIRGKSLNYLIVRSSPLLGRGNGLNLSFLDRLRMALDRGKRLEFAANQLHSFATVDGLVDVIARAIDAGVRNKTVHYGGLTKVSTHELARLFAKRFRYDPSLIGSINGGRDRDEFDFSLNSSQICELLKLKPLLLEESFDLIDKNLIPRA